ncbi:hypothetical protein QTP86_023114, partial [Hemibagrus guttatus]
MAKVPVGKVLLRNVIRHTDAHNKIQEESEMWKLRDMERQTLSSRESKDSWNTRSSMHCDRYLKESEGSTRGRLGERACLSEGDEREARYWTRKLYEFEANDPDRWGHSGFKELYPEEFQQSDRETDAKHRRNGKDKLSTEKQKKTKKSSKRKRKKKKKKQRTEGSDSESDSSMTDGAKRKQKRKSGKSKHRRKKAHKHKTTEQDNSTEDSESDRGRERTHGKRHQTTMVGPWQGFNSDITKSLKDLEIGIVELQALAESRGDRRHVEELKVMADLLGTEAQGALIRSRFKGANVMDAPSKYFFGLEKKNGQSRLIHTLHTRNGQYTTHTYEIRWYAMNFYQDLYRSEHRDSKELLDIFYQGLPKDSSEDNAALEGPLVLEELHAALNTMPGGKAPGIDWPASGVLQVLLERAGRRSAGGPQGKLQREVSTPEQPEGMITLLPKKGDLQDIKNWRPVSLLCTDYKVMSKVLANCLGDIMDSVIQTDQTYCVPNRSIIDNVSLIRDILDVSRSLAGDLGLISLDQEKAFDRVEHQYLWKTLEAFGLSPSLIAMMKVLYQDVESVLKINGGLSAPFKVQRGIRQGCSLSARTLFKRGSHGPAVSLYWLLEEPLVGGGRMDIKDSSPGLTHITQSRQFTTLKRLVDTAGPELKDTRAVAEELSL